MRAAFERQRQQGAVAAEELRRALTDMFEDRPVDVEAAVAVCKSLDQVDRAIDMMVPRAPEPEAAPTCRPPPQMRCPGVRMSSSKMLKVVVPKPHRLLVVSNHEKLEITAAPGGARFVVTVDSSQRDTFVPRRLRGPFHNPRDAVERMLEYHAGRPQMTPAAKAALFDLLREAGCDVGDIYRRWGKLLPTKAALENQWTTICSDALCDKVRRETEDVNSEFELGSRIAVTHPSTRACARDASLCPSMPGPSALSLPRPLRHATHRTAADRPTTHARTHARHSPPRPPTPAPPRQQVLGDPFCQTAAALAAAGHGRVEAFDLHDLFSEDVNVCKPGLTMGSGGYLCVLAAAVLKRPAAAGTVVLQAARSLK
jgi:hypothetical protein